MTNTQSQLIIETKESIIEYVPRLLEACDQVGEMLQSNEAGWAKTLNQLFDGINWTISAVAGIRKLELNEFANAPIDELILILPQLADALENKDLVSTADILQYDIKRGLEGIFADAG